MKLFGDTGSHLHIRSEKAEKPKAPAKSPGLGAELRAAGAERAAQRAEEKAARAVERAARLAEEETAVAAAVAAAVRETTEPKPASAPSPERTVSDTLLYKPEPPAEEAPTEAPERPPLLRRLRVPLMIVGGVLALALILTAAYVIWEKPPAVREDGPVVRQTVHPAVTDPPVVKPTEGPQVTEPPELPEETEAPEATPDPFRRKENCYTFLLLAYDQLQANTDTILVGRLDTDEGTLNIVNIPRDTLVNVSWGVKKINTVLANERNDPERFLEHLSDVIGFSVDCYAVVDIKSVEKLVDCIGGVNYNVPRNMDYDDPTQDLHIHISAGEQLLNGENAVKVLRFRQGNDGTGYANGDLGRIATQQDFLMSLASQFLRLGNIPNLPEALKIFETYVRTDLDASNLAFFAREFLMLDKSKISFHTEPGDGAYIRGGAYYQINVEEWLPIVNECLNPYLGEITEENLSIVQYLNEYAGAETTSGDVLPIGSFYDFSQYTG